MARIDSRTETFEQKLKRFAAKLVKHGTSDCLVWIAAKDRDGYGWFIYTHKKQVYAHRAAWMLVYGDIPAGMQVLHTCDNPSCVNIDHLFLGTHQDNMDDKRTKKRQGGGRPRMDFCIRGHARTRETSYRSTRADGSESWNCKQCSKLRYEEKKNPMGLKAWN